MTLVTETLFPTTSTKLLAGGGIRGGQIYGASDSIGAYVKDLPVTPDDYMATILHAFGYAPESDRDRGPDCSGTPPTPPSMRVRTRRFDAWEQACSRE